jgi:heme/copper-type cytochrome/quinol oxidase subunit 4
METALEEETYSKVIYIIVGILAIILTVVILDVMTGGSLIKTLVCGMVWYLPVSGSVLAGYLGCGGIAL